jgi:hypothetical protein
MIISVHQYIKTLIFKRKLFCLTLPPIGYWAGTPRRRQHAFWVQPDAITYLK